MKIDAVNPAPSTGNAAGQVNRSPETEDTNKTGKTPAYKIDVSKEAQEQLENEQRTQEETENEQVKAARQADNQTKTYNAAGNITEEE